MSTLLEYTVRLDSPRVEAVFSDKFKEVLHVPLNTQFASQMLNVNFEEFWAYFQVNIIRFEVLALESTQVRLMHAQPRSRRACLVSLAFLAGFAFNFLIYIAVARAAALTASM